jgi:hypothetical protein
LTFPDTRTGRDKDAATFAPLRVSVGTEMRASPEAKNFPEGSTRIESKGKNIEKRREEG